MDVAQGTHSQDFLRPRSSALHGLSAAWEDFRCSDEALTLTLTHTVKFVFRLPYLTLDGWGLGHVPRAWHSTLGTKSTLQTYLSSLFLFL